MEGNQEEGEEEEGGGEGNGRGRHFSKNLFSSRVREVQVDSRSVEKKDERTKERRFLLKLFTPLHGREGG